MDLAKQLLESRPASRALVLSMESLGLSMVPRNAGKSYRKFLYVVDLGGCLMLFGMARVGRPEYREVVKQRFAVDFSSTNPVMVDGRS